MNSNWSYSPETVKLGVDLCDIDLWPLTLTFCMDVTFVIGNNSWKFHDDTMMGTWWKRCDGRTDRRTDRQTDWTSHIAAWSQLKIRCSHDGNPHTCRQTVYIYIDGLVQERHNPLPTHWSYIFLALNHRYCYCPEGLNLYFSSSSWILNWVYFRLSCCRFFPCFLSFGKR